jgi:hypothetical protein
MAIATWSQEAVVGVGTRYVRLWVEWEPSAGPIVLPDTSPCGQGENNHVGNMATLELTRFH